MAPKTIGFFHYVLSNGYAKYEVDRWIYDTVRDATSFLSIFIFPIDAKNHWVLVIRDLNGYGEYEFDRCICDKVMACWRVAAAEAETEAETAAEPKT